MKILIAYDGSEGADAALDDLPKAGLPGRAEALVVVTDVWLTSSPAEYARSIARRRMLSADSSSSATTGIAWRPTRAGTGCLITSLVANSPCTIGVARAPLRATAGAFLPAAHVPFHAAAAGAG